MVSNMLQAEEDDDDIVPLWYAACLGSALDNMDLDTICSHSKECWPDVYQRCPGESVYKLRNKREKN